MWPGEVWHLFGAADFHAQYRLIVAYMKDFGAKPGRGFGGMLQCFACRGAFGVRTRSEYRYKVPEWKSSHCDLVMLSVRYWRERFSAGARLGRKGEKSIRPRACSRKWAVLIVVSI